MAVLFSRCHSLASIMAGLTGHVSDTNLGGAVITVQPIITDLPPKQAAPNRVSKNVNVRQFFTPIKRFPLSETHIYAPHFTQNCPFLFRWLIQRMTNTRTHFSR